MHRVLQYLTRIVITTTFAVTLGPAVISQNLWIVSNDPAFPGDFDNIQEAVDSADSGDKIYVVGSSTLYLGPIIDKKLHLIGPGYWKTENSINDENVQSAQIGSSILQVGSDSTIIEGFYFLSSLDIYSDNVVVRYNRLTGIPANNPAIEFFGIPVNVLVYGNIWDSYLAGSATGAIIRNNIVLYHVTGYTAWLSNASNMDCLVQNNAFASTYSNYFVSNCTFRNNIVMAPSFQIYNCDFEHNIFVDDDVVVDGMPEDSLGNGNIDSVDIATVWDLANPSPDGKYQLIGDSMTNPAINAGINGEDCGPFTGNTTYRLSGIVQIPTIYQMLIPLVGDTTNMLNVTIKAKSNE